MTLNHYLYMWPLSLCISKYILHLINVIYNLYYFTIWSGVKEGDIIASIKVVKGLDKFIPGKSYVLPSVPSVAISAAEL